MNVTKSLLMAVLINLSVVGLISQGAASAQAPLAATRQRAERGDAAAQYSLGLSYDYGLDAPQDDARAEEWYRRAAEQGHAGAQYNLGVMYANGEGVPQDFTEAVAWYRRAAAQGHTSARYRLGVMYVNGEGVPEDDAEAMEWFRTAADEGEVPAQYMLGVMYARQTAGLWGRRSPNYVEAHRWFNLAASHITVTSEEQFFYAEMRDKTAKLMTPAQIAEAQRLAKEWQAAFEQRQN